MSTVVTNVTRRPRQGWRIAVSAITAAVSAVLVVLSAALFVVPRLLGGDALTVLTGSMEPTFHPGDIMVVRGIDPDDVCDSVTPGDVISYFPQPDDPTLISHRVVGKTVGDFGDGTDCRLVTQGDANTAIDDPVSPHQVRGVLAYGVPRLGWVREWVAQHQMAAWGIVAAVVLLVWFAPGRKSVKTILMPGLDTPGDAAPAAAAPAPPGAEELDLRRRELELKEREIALREAQFYARHPEARTPVAHPRHAAPGLVLTLSEDA